MPNKQKKLRGGERRGTREREKRKESKIDTVYWRRAGFMRQLLLRTTAALSACANGILARRIERRNILPINTVLSSWNFKWCRCAFSNQSGPHHASPLDPVSSLSRDRYCARFRASCATLLRSSASSSSLTLDEGRHENRFTIISRRCQSPRVL